MDWIKAKKILSESLPVLILAPLLSLLAGVMLNSTLEGLARVPILLTLAPIFSGRAGDFGVIIASRLTSALHLGLIPPRLERNPVLRTYLLVDVTVILIAAVYVSLVLHFLSPVFGVPSVGLPFLLFITGLGFLIIVLVIFAVGVLVAIFTYASGLDPSNVSFPIVTAVGDVAGVATLILISRVLGLL